MKFLLDENIGSSVAHHLKEMGHDVIWVGEDLQGLEDELILAKAFREKRILITLDQDFGQLVFLYLRPHCGVVLLKPWHDSVETRIELIKQLLKKYGGYLTDKFVVVSEKKTRRR